MPLFLKVNLAPKWPSYAEMEEPYRTLFRQKVEMVMPSPKDEDIEANFARWRNSEWCNIESVEVGAAVKANPDKEYSESDLLTSKSGNLYVVSRKLISGYEKEVLAELFSILDKIGGDPISWDTEKAMAVLIKKAVKHGLALPEKVTAWRVASKFKKPFVSMKELLSLDSYEEKWAPLEAIYRDISGDSMERHDIYMMAWLYDRFI